MLTRARDGIDYMTPVATVRAGSPSLRAAVLLVAAALLLPLGSSTESGDVVGASQPPASDFVVHVAPSGMGNFAGEPSIGVNRASGNVMYQALTETLRVTFDDSVSPATATWTAVQPLQTSITNNDPILFTDPATGRTYAGGLNPPCSVLAMTDDDGQTWQPVGNACALPGVDHETIASGPWRGAPPAQATHPRALYYCVHELVQMCATSADGGLTFGPALPINTGLECLGLFGHVKVAADGRAYVPGRACTDETGAERAAVTRTETNGLTWLTFTVPGSDLAPNGFDSSVATTPSGFLYLAWEGANGHPYVAHSRTRGQSWSAPVDIVAGTGIETATFVAAVAGDDDRAAVAFLGTRDEGDAFAADFTGTWDLYVARSIDSGATWSVQQVTTDPVQRGLICAGGTVGCPVDPATGAQLSRNLLDFIDATIDAEGRILVAFADGCVGDCVQGGTAADSQAAKATIARQVGGACLIAGGCGDASGTPVEQVVNDQCDSETVIFSSNSLGTPALNSHAAFCIAGGVPGTDTAIVNPGSDQVSIRYIGDPGTPTLSALVDGLGIDNDVLTLLRTADGATASVTYDSATVAIDATARGSITAIVYDGDVELDRVTFHTVG